MILFGRRLAMPPADLVRMVRAQPFVPFRIHLDGGTVYRINHPELVMVGIASAIVAFPDEQRPELYRSWEIVDLRHISRLERIELANQAS
jgi:hypothetical protein